MKLAKKGAISHRSAMVYYELTDQVFSKVYITVPREKGANLSVIKEYDLKGTRYQLIRVAPQHYWGVKAVFLGEARIWITDLEKTLIDGLTRPDLCGGFREVIFAFEKGATGLSPPLILEYAKRISLVTCKRLGWMLEQLGVHKEIQEQLRVLPMPYTQRLDASGTRKGKVIQRWNLLENI
jgi:predicted transcriptional regulator of viral defense system